MRVLVVQTAFLGDMILTLPLLDLLRSTGAASPLAVLAAPAGARLLETQGAADVLIEFDKRQADSGPVGTLRAARAAREFRADAVLIPHRSFRSAAIAALAGSPRRIGFDESGGRALLTESLPYRAHEHEIERVASLATALGVELPPGRVPFRIRVPEDARERIERTLAANTGCPLALLAPGSRWTTKRWPAERYAALADRLAGAGFRVVLAGGEADAEVSAAVASLSDTETLDTTGRISVAEWLALVERSTIVISNDSAAAHAAAGTGVAAVAVFGPTVPAQGFAPYTDRARVIEVDLECRPCGKHGAEHCARGTLQCMMDVSVDEVLNGVLGLLGSATGAEGDE